ncbi:Gfo/Idh/MocA family protein [Alloyangia pacifica]|uniref:Predicted dehydrogenase n=1 Tax=Alloyangia pacifica TaxID=311180 RepID=A0A1I6WE18_9RHOB|nr:Gfo/Idh/MocA family oxidoreductase [Alloyangia pacifica]SDI61680.1 Predicted dehydrogenase [Alloyangia pacifica]SFT24233.1 Predicted dehydrogenase [Alloyangia pacifica]
MGLGFVGTGYVADLYLNTLPNWDSALDLRVVHDRDADRLNRFSSHYGVKPAQSLEAVLADPSVEIVVNLTNPAQHYEVSLRALEAGKHVYSEKPLALELEQAQELVQKAEARGLHLVSAPATVLGEAAQTFWQAVREKVLGRPVLAYVEMDDGMVHRIGYRNWITRTGARWPAEDEFRTGCTLEHAGYSLTWLVAMFGPVRRVVTVAHCAIPDKGPDTPPDYDTPDFSCACLEFDDGMVARLTNSIIAPHDHRFRVFCEDGYLDAAETWDFKTPVRAVPLAETRLRRQAQKLLGWDGGHRIKPTHSRSISTARRGYPIDFALGLAEMALALRSGRAPRLAGAFSLHVTEVSLAIQHPERFGTVYRPISAPGPVQPMDWSEF